jgi:hypothetical protein
VCAYLGRIENEAVFTGRTVLASDDVGCGSLVN